MEEINRLKKEKETKLMKMPMKKDDDADWQGVTLRGDKLTGSLSGTMKLPRTDYFEITVVVTKTRPLELEQGNKSDSVTVRMGPDLKKLVKVLVTVLVTVVYSTLLFQHAVCVTQVYMFMA